MSKTVAEIIKEYNNRQSKKVIKFIRFKTFSGVEGFSNITNIMRNDISIDIPELDMVNGEMHKYEFDSGYDGLDGTPLKWSHRKFYGKIVDIVQEIEYEE